MEKKMIQKKIKNDLRNMKPVFSPLIEIVHFNKSNKQDKKETYPISHYLDLECRKLKAINNQLN